MLHQSKWLLILWQVGFFHAAAHGSSSKSRASSSSNTKTQTEIASTGVKAASVASSSSAAAAAAAVNILEEFKVIYVDGILSTDVIELLIVFTAGVCMLLVITSLTDFTLPCQTQLFCCRHLKWAFHFQSIDGMLLWISLKLICIPMNQLTCTVYYGTRWHFQLPPVLVKLFTIDCWWCFSYFLSSYAWHFYSFI